MGLASSRCRALPGQDGQAPPTIGDQRFTLSANTGRSPGLFANRFLTGAARSAFGLRLSPFCLPAPRIGL
ncbi:MAG: hypothetical protein RMI90_09115 [Thermoguttaceae bacterium]|nr:hypothetical protein [Thermoguttaceae bacterium]